MAIRYECSRGRTGDTTPMMEGAHYDDADAQADDEPTELADNHDGVAVDRERIQATFEYEVTLTDEQIEGLRDSMTAAEFAENLAASRMNKELDPTFSISSNDAIAKESDAWREDGETTFDVFVRVAQND